MDPNERDDEKVYIRNAELHDDYALDDIMAEYGEPDRPAPPAEDLENTLRHIILDAIDGADSVAGASFSSLDDMLDDAVEKTIAEVDAAKADKQEPEPDEDAPDPTEDVEPTEAADTEQPVNSEPEFSEVSLSDEALPSGGTEYASPDFPEEDIPPTDIDEERREKAKERFLSPLVAVLALIALRRGQRSGGEAHAPTVEDEQLPDPNPKKAAKHYASQLASLKLRGRLTAVLSIVLIYISFASTSALPLFGALGSSSRALCLTQIILLLTVMLTALDIFTAGIASMCRGRLGHETLAALSAVFCVLDAAVSAAAGLDYGLPFCAVAASALCAELWGAYYTCRAYRHSFRVLGSSSGFYSVTGEYGVTDKHVALMKSHLGAEGFIRRSEQADISEYAYSAITPFLLAAAVIFSLLATVFHGSAGAFLHCLASLTAVSSSFSAALAFALPYAVTARDLAQSGAAIAGWEGARDIGLSHSVVITDTDVFPSGTVAVSGIRILEGAYTDKVVSYTASVLTASGCGLVHAFSTLMRRNGWTLCRVEGFEPHDGGGMTAVVNGESVCIGGSAFMNLIGVRVPQKLNAKSSVYTAINGTLVGIFEITYTPTASVQGALAVLLHSNQRPVFATRDFNITPALIKQLFRMPTDRFDFPAYAERCRISSAEPDEHSRTDAVITREGMGPLVDVSDKGSRLYRCARISVAISAAGSVLGLVLLFMLFWAGAYSSAGVSNVLTFMLLWLIPCIVLTLSLKK
ncbi:MAG: hypothetical protein LUE06_06430 [Oscillospiraceae bacterium]|nr:hypothetical protein [Oscillospiraceae bacterium]